MKPGAQERAQVGSQALPAPAAGAVVLPDAAKAAAKRKQQWKEFGRALLFMSPAIVFLIAFTYIPFLRSIWLSFFVTTPQGATARFNGINYYTRIFNLDGSDSKNSMSGPAGTVETTSKLAWEGPVLTVATKASVQGQEISQTEKWSLAPDGKTLNLERVVGFGGQNMSIKIAFNKQ